MTVGKDKVLILRNLSQISEMILSGTINRNLEWIALRMSTLVDIVERNREEKEKNPEYVPLLSARETDILNSDISTPYTIDGVMKQLLQAVLQGASSAYKYFYYKNLFCSLTLYATGGLLELKVHNSIELISHGFINHDNFDTDTIIDSIDESVSNTQFDNTPIKFLMALSANSYLYHDIIGIGEWNELGLVRRNGTLYYNGMLCDPNTEDGIKCIQNVYDIFMDRALPMAKYNMAVRYSELLAMLYLER